MLAAVLPDAPSVVVIDEVPWLAEQDDVLEGALQAAWDRLLARWPVLLLLVLGPLNPADTGRALGLEAVDAVDAD